MSVTASIMLLAASIVLVRTVCLAAKMSARDFNGHLFRFASIAAANAFLAAGAVGIVLGWHHGTLLLLVGAAVKLVSDRRNGNA
jgi:hypothetical protein